MRGWLIFSSVKFSLFVYASQRKKAKNHFVAERLLLIFIKKNYIFLSREEGVLFEKFEGKGKNDAEGGSKYSKFNIVNTLLKL